MEVRLFERVCEKAPKEATKRNKGMKTIA
jgi:hypothetical protein